MEAKFQNAHLAFLNVLEIASDDNTTGPEKDAVVAAVKELGERLNSLSERCAYPEIGGRKRNK